MLLVNGSLKLLSLGNEGEIARESMKLWRLVCIRVVSSTMSIGRSGGTLQRARESPSVPIVVLIVTKRQATLGLERASRTLLSPFDSMSPFDRYLDRRIAINHRDRFAWSWSFRVRWGDLLGSDTETLTSTVAKINHPDRLCFSVGRSWLPRCKFMFS